MKRTIYSLLSIIIMMVAPENAAAQSSANPQFNHEKFAVEVPNLNRFVRVTTNGVNIRKAPDVKSPKLVMKVNLSEECYDCPPDLIWVNRPLRKNENSATADQYDTFPLIGETGDWYEIYLHEYKGTLLQTSAYIMKKFGKIEKLKPLQLPTTDPYDLIVMIPSGKYAGLCIESYIDEYQGETYLRLGKYVNGMFVSPYSITIERSDDKGIRFANDYNFYTLKFANSYWEDSIGPSNLKLKQLITSEDFLEFLMTNLDKMNSNTTTVLYGVEGVEYLNRMEIQKQ